MPSNPDELNPHHPTTKAVHDHWHKIAAVLMLKFGQRDVLLTPKDLAKLEGSNIAIRDDKEGIRVWLVDDKEAERLARIQGGVSNS